MEKSGNLMSAVLQSHSKAGSEWEWERERVHESAPCVLQLFFSVRLACRICNETLLFVTGPDHLVTRRHTQSLEKGEKGVSWSFCDHWIWVQDVCLGFSFCIVRLFLLSLPLSLLLCLWVWTCECLWAYPFCPAVPLFVSGVALDISV